MSDYKISIILPTYNVENYIVDTFDSIKRQTIGFESLEVIFVDDVSTDNSKKIIVDWAQKYENVNALFLEKNSGYAGRPRNLGIQAATAPYLMFLDPDDMYEEDACEKLYNAAKKNDSDIVGGYYYCVDYSGKTIRNSQMFKNVESFKVESFREKPELFTMLVGFWTRIYKSDFVKSNKIVFNEDIPGQDQIFILDCITKASGIAYIKECIVKYRIRDKTDKSISFNVTPKYIMGVGKAYELMYEILKKNGYTMWYNNIIETFAGYFINAIIDSEKISDEQISKCLSALQFTIEKCYEAKYFSDVEYVKNISALVAIKDYKAAEIIVKSLRPIRKYLIELETGKNWLESQYNSYLELQEKHEELKNEYEKLQYLIVENNGLISQNNGLINQNNYLIVKNNDLEERYRVLSVEHEWLKEKIHGSALCRLARKTKGWYKHK